MKMQQELRQWQEKREERDRQGREDQAAAQEKRDERDRIWRQEQAEADRTWREGHAKKQQEWQTEADRKKKWELWLIAAAMIVAPLLSACLQKSPESPVINVPQQPAPVVNVQPAIQLPAPADAKMAKTP
jgi:hypothetical protein